MAPTLTTTASIIASMVQTFKTSAILWPLVILFTLKCISAREGDILWTWKTDTVTGLNNDIIYRPQVRDNAVYVTSRNKFLYKLNATTGARIWRKIIRNIYSIATLHPTDDIVFVSSQVNGVKQRLYAINSETKETLWTKDGYDTDFSIRPATIAGDQIYWMGNDHVFTSNIHTGAIINAHNTDTQVKQIPYNSKRNHIYFGDSKNSTVNFAYSTEAGRVNDLVWSQNLNMSMNFGIVDGDYLYVSCAVSTTINVYKLRTSDGNIEWSTSVVNANVKTHLDKTLNLLILTKLTNFIVAIHTGTGSIAWEQPFYGDADTWADSSLSPTSVLYVVTSNYITAYDIKEQGEVRWQYPVSSTAQRSIRLDPNKRLVYVTVSPDNQGTLYAFKTDAYDSEAPTADPNATVAADDTTADPGAPGDNTGANNSRILFTVSLSVLGGGIVVVLIVAVIFARRT